MKVQDFLALQVFFTFISDNSKTLDLQVRKERDDAAPTRCDAAMWTIATGVCRGG